MDESKTLIEEIKAAISEGFKTIQAKLKGSAKEEEDPTGTPTAEEEEAKKAAEAAEALAADKVGELEAKIVADFQAKFDAKFTEMGTALKAANDEVARLKGSSAVPPPAADPSVLPPAASLNDSAAKEWLNSLTDGEKKQLELAAKMNKK